MLIVMVGYVSSVCLVFGFWDKVLLVALDGLELSV